MTYKIKSPIITCFIVAWLGGVILQFVNYGEHFSLFYYLASSSVNFLLLGAITLAAFSLGGRVFHRLKVSFTSRLETFVFSASLGFGIISFLIFVLGVLHLLYRNVAYGLLLILLIFSVPQIRTFLKSAHEEETEKKKDNSPLTLILSIIFITSTCLYLVQAFAPPLNYDSLAYHLAAPKLYAEQHGIFYIPHNVYANFPMTTEFLYLFSLLLYGDTLAKLIHFSMGILIVLGIYSFSVKYFGKKAALLASLTFYNIPLVGLLSGWAYNDLMLTLYEFLAVAALLKWLLPGNGGENESQDSAGAAKKKPSSAGKPSLTGQERCWLHASAIFCGLAIGTKYPALLLLLPILLLAIAVKLSLDGKNRFKEPALFVFISLLAASPWLIKNIFYTHNPVYPYFYVFFHQLFGHPSGETFDHIGFMLQHQPRNAGIGHVLSLFWKVNMDAKIGPVFILFLPLLLFIRSVKPVIKLFLIYGGIYFVLWGFLTHQDTRFLIPVLPVLCIASAYAVDNFSANKKLTLFMYIVILFVFLLNLSWMPLTIGKYDLLKAAVGIKGREEFLLDSEFYQYPAFHYINDELPENAKILFVGENQTYYCNREIVSNSPLDTNIIVEMVNGSSSEEDIMDKLRLAGITHVLFNSSEAKRVARDYKSFNFKDGKDRLFAEFFYTSCKYLKEVFSESGVFVYEISYD